MPVYLRAARRALEEAPRERKEESQGDPLARQGHDAYRDCQKAQRDGSMRALLVHGDGKGGTMSDIDAGDRWEANYARKMGRSYCSECYMTGTHATGCPEAPEAEIEEEEKKPETDSET
jgi:hypothetical protein